ncbi:hypothetical protein Tco_0326155, partial [Tanacetum coccineum]
MKIKRTRLVLITTKRTLWVIVVLKPNAPLFDDNHKTKGPLVGLLSQTHPFRVLPQPNAPVVVAAVVAAKVGAAAVGDGDGWRWYDDDDGGGMMMMMAV